MPRSSCSRAGGDRAGRALDLASITSGAASAGRAARAARRGAWIVLLSASGLLGSVSHARAQYPGALAGRVRDALTDEPVPAARVTLLGAGGASTSTDGRGEFRIGGLEPGIHRVEIARLGYVTAVRSVEVENGGRAWLAAALTPDPLALTGVLTEPGRAEPGTRVIDRAEIERIGARTAADALAGQVGVTVDRRGPGSPATLSIRGSADDQVLVLLDGVPLNDPLTGSADLSTVPAFQIESITLLRGGRSARYGPRAAAGVVLIETRRTAHPLGLRAGAGSLGEWSGAAEAAGPLGGWAWSAGAEHRSIGGRFEFERPEAIGGGHAVRENADLREESGFIALTGDAAGGALRLRGSHDRLSRGLPGLDYLPSTHARERLSRWQGQVGWERDERGVRTGLQAHALHQNARFSDPAPPIGPGYDSRAEALVLGSRASVELAPAGHLVSSLAGGAEARYQRYRSSELEDSAPDERTDLGLFGRATFGRDGGPARGPAVTVGLRLDRSDPYAGWRLSHELTGRLGSRALEVYARHASSYSPPTFGDRFFREGVAVRPNPELRGERVPNELGLGVAARLGSRGVTGRVALDLYRADVRDMIIWAPDFRFVWSPRNFNVKRRGLDLSAWLALPGPGLELRGHYSLTRVVYDRPGDADTVQVVYRPRHSGAASVRWGHDGWSIGTEVRYMGARYPVPAPVNALDPFWTIDLNARRRVALRGWELSVALVIERLFDDRSSLIFGYPEPGRTIRLAITARPRTTFNGGPP